jgi:2-keto-3-deoxy-L-rhamnonate aldolase RhmA
MTLDEAWETVAAACKRHGKAFGGPTLAPEEMKKRHAQGAQFLVNSSEFHGWANALKRDVQGFDTLA